jgi:threonine dehydrogenase-like Zn-dependent dehydrogenase
MCRTLEKFGLTVDGAARRQILIEERHLHRASPALDMSVLALAEPLSVCAAGIVAAGGAHDADLAAQRILVIGGGMIGSGCVLLLRRLFGCTQVFVHDLQPSRLARAAAFGAKALTIIPASPIGDAGYGAIYSGDGFDVIIETSGSASAFAQAQSLLNPSGTLAMLGFLSEVSFAPKDLVIKAGRLVGSIGGSGMFETVVPWLERHADEARPLITHSLSAEHAERAFDIAADGDQALKVQLAFR